MTLDSTRIQFLLRIRVLAVLCTSTRTGPSVSSPISGSAVIDLFWGKRLRDVTDGAGRNREAATALSRGIRSGLKLLSHAEAARSGKFLSLSPIESKLGLGALLSVLNPDVGFLLGHKSIYFMAVTRGFHATILKRMGGHGHDEPF
ncbi:hypothetical protein C4D60_Mb10t18990 [Musa balbisiana]|uniref:Uncharacterized protein n=1 Tax=Musa balbisiana TaxID=52838 RepID=A0A4S8IZL8_MUSBA|nr:hypothetical protein C4D60_Mb10t18990 [Musa balbisiana]